MKKIDEILNGVSCMAIAGHVRPDGDCIGSCLGLYQYLRDNRPEIQADVYLEDPRPEFSYLPGFSEVKTSCEEKAYDLVVLLDVSSEDRIGVAAPLLAKAGKTICIDHHVTNTEYCEINHVAGCKLCLRGAVWASGGRKDLRAVRRGAVHRYCDRFRRIPVQQHLSAHDAGCGRSDGKGSSVLEIY